MKITKRELKEILKEEIEATIDEGAELKIPVERYDAFKRKIEQWAMLFGKFTRYTKDLNLQSFDRKTDGKRIVRQAHELEQELRKIMDQFGLDYKDYSDEHHKMRQQLDQFDGGHEFFLEEDDDSFSKAGEEIEKKGTEGKFTANAKKRGMSAQEFAKKVLANPDEYDIKTVRQASFAKGAATVAKNRKKKKK